MPLIALNRNIVVAPNQILAGWIAQALSPLVKPFIQQEIQSMSANLNEAVANLQAATQRAVSEVSAAKAESAAKDQTIADLTAKLAAAQAGDPAVVSAIDNATASLDQIAPPPAPAPEPDQNQPQG